MNMYGLHTVFEIAAYSLGFQFYLRERRRLNLSTLAGRDRAVVVASGAIIGAALGSKISYWMYDPMYAFADFPSPLRLLAGKSVIGGLLGGLAGVEIGKRLEGIQGSTGDAFVRPLQFGMIIGRIGCFLTGLDDHTSGNPTDVPWAYDYGDGIPRHPTQIYEIIFQLILAIGMYWKRDAFTESGDRFRVFLVSYLIYRLFIEAIRPIPFYYFGLFSGLQLLCIFGLFYHIIFYGRDLLRIVGRNTWLPR